MVELGVLRIGLQRAGKPGKARREYEQSRRFRLVTSGHDHLRAVTLAWIREHFFATGFLHSFASIAIGGAVIDPFPSSL
ncbi:hypothetical protein ABZ484_34925 [Streptomyces sp. NPDC006393]|uniref:hypothetical protein n=1 Tax=Streptomyces sp. NPDC006393 TaxID=3156763 RepID=UPI0033C05EC0